MKRVLKLSDMKELDINKFMRISLGVFACYETGTKHENKLCDGWADKELQIFLSCFREDIERDRETKIDTVRDRKRDRW